MTIEELMRDCRLLSERLEEIQNDLLSLRKNIDQEAKKSWSVDNHMYVRDFCNRYLFCSDSFVVSTVGENEFDESKYHQTGKDRRKYTYIDPKYFVQYINQYRDEHPAVFNRMQKMINISEDLKKLAIESGIVNELL